MEGSKYFIRTMQKTFLREKIGKAHYINKSKFNLKKLSLWIPQLYKLRPKLLFSNVEKRIICYKVVGYTYLTKYAIGSTLLMSQNVYKNILVDKRQTFLPATDLCLGLEFLGVFIWNNKHVIWFSRQQKEADIRCISWNADFSTTDTVTFTDFSKQLMNGFYQPTHEWFPTSLKPAESGATPNSDTARYLEGKISLCFGMDRES